LQCPLRVSHYKNMIIHNPQYFNSTQLNNT